MFSNKYENTHQVAIKWTPHGKRKRYITPGTWRITVTVEGRVRLQEITGMSSVVSAKNVAAGEYSLIIMLQPE